MGRAELEEASGGPAASGGLPALHFLHVRSKKNKI